METWLALVLAAVAFGGIVIAIRLKEAESKLTALQERVTKLEPQPEAEGSYREAPALPQSAFSALIATAQQDLARVDVDLHEPSRPLVDRKGRATDCPVCDSWVHVSNPTFFPNGCDEPTCGRKIAHLHQHCGCGATWATRAKS